MTPTAGNEMKVVWTRGNGCSELAELLSEVEPDRITGDLVEQCINHRADLLVSRRFPGSFDLVNVAVPLDFHPDNVTRVVSAVAGGPHSFLAADTASRIGRRLGVEAEMLSAIRPGDDPHDAEVLLDHMGLSLPEMGGRVMEVVGISDLVETLGEGALLVLGAPGGSWLQRSMFGPGARLRSKAPAGAIMVRSAPDRVFRWMGEPVFVSPLRLADDTLLLHHEKVLAVADRGMLIGLVRRESLEGAGTAAVGSVMEEAVSAKVDETIAEAMELEPTFGNDPIPVTDHHENLVGGLSLPVG
ncbi:MAG TPA: hypothetical protein VLA91_09275 [Acidimicrobiia bacterium]|nr:hypothetical protein [Acidimicrobiia bacterium]